MSRPLRPGLVAEGDSDCDFLAPVIDRQLQELTFANPTADFDLFSIRRSAYVKKHGQQRFRAAALQLAKQCHIVFVHADYHEGHEAEQLAREIDGKDCCPIVIVPKRETEAWLLADSRAFRRVRGAAVHLLPADPGHVERLPDPKLILRRVMEAAGVKRSADYFSLMGEDIRLEVLENVPAYKSWLVATREALEGLGYL